MHTFLIIGGAKEERIKKLTSLMVEDHITTFDIRPLTLTEELSSIGIALVRNWQKQLLLMPTSSPYAAGVIESAELLTTEAQNALLKTLEEPPIHTRIYMEAQSDNAFLPTILSRCQIIKLSDETTKLTKKEETQLETVRQLFQTAMSKGNIIATIDTLVKNKNEAQLWIDQAIQAIHKTKSSWPIATYVSIQKQLMQAKKQLTSNVQYKLVLDDIFLSFTTRQS